jgi:hypothetical protein
MSGLGFVGFTVWHRWEVYKTAVDFQEAIERDCYKNKMATLGECLSDAFDVRMRYLEGTWPETLLYAGLSFIAFWIIAAIAIGAMRWVEDGN